MKAFLLKLKCKAQQDIEEPSSSSANGRIVVSRKKVHCHEYALEEKSVKAPLEPQKLRITSAAESNANQEWQHIFQGANEDAHVATAAPPSSEVASVAPLAGSGASTALTVGVAQTNIANAATSLGEYTIPDRNFWQERSSECRQDLEKLRTKIKNRYSVLTLSHQDNFKRHSLPYPTGWRMTGTMIAHLHEHSESVIKLASIKPYGSLFASGSIDGTVRLWDCNKLNGNQGINKSRQVYPANTPVYSLAACDNGQSLAVGGKDGSLLVMRIDRNSSKMTLQQALHLDRSGQYNDGPVVDMQTYDHISQNVIIYATLYGSIVAWDTRMQNNAWRLQNELRHGVITTICADPTGSWLTTGTSGGKHICWDLRFRLPITEIKHPADSWIRKVTCHPTEPSCLISASQSNNEVSVWNIETGHRQTVLWASSAPVLSNTSLNDPSTTCGILSGVVDNSPFILTGSSDQRIRFWNLAMPTHSALIVPSSNDNLTDISFDYRAPLIDGSQVIEETIIQMGNVADVTSLRSSAEENPRSGPEVPSASHHDAITDLLMCKTDRSKINIVSAARDGVIKVWK